MKKQNIDDLNKLFHQANKLYQDEKYEEAINIYKDLLEKIPNDTALLANYASALYKTKQYQKSLNLLNKSLNIDPKHVGSLVNRGDLYKRIGEFDKAKIDLEKAVKLAPNLVDAHINLGFLYLTIKEYQKGWEHLKYRYTKLNLPKCPYPYWNGELKKDKVLLILAEQGFGDTIWMARVNNYLKEKGLLPVWGVDSSLVELFNRNNIEAYEQDFLLQNQNKFLFDYYIYLFDMHRVLNITPINIRNFVDTDRAYIKTQDSLNIKNDSLNIGFAYSGNKKHKNDKNRSIKLDIFSKLFDSNANFFAIQKNVDIEKLISFEKENIFDTSPLLNSFADTAAVVNSMDVIITVDTSLAHLAGAMGKETWLLLPYVADWRWLQEGNNTKWYPSVKIFRQKIDGDWESVIKEISLAINSKMIELV